MFKISVVVRPRRKHHHARTLALLGRQGEKRIAADVKEARQLANAVLAEDAWARCAR